MPIKAKVDGFGILEFPDNTPFDVVQATVKRVISERGQPQASQPQPQPANPIQQADSKLMQAVNQSAGLADPLLNFVKQSRQPAQTGQASSQYVNPAVFAGEEVAPPPAFASEEARQRFERGAVNIPRFGGPMLAPEGGPRGAVFSGLGEAIAQTIEKFLGQREGYNEKEIIASATQGAVPNIPGSGFGRAAANVGAQAAGGMAAEAIRTGGTNVVSGGVIPGTVTAATRSVSGIAGATGRAFGNAAQRAEEIEKIGAKPTFGQAMPSMAAMEARIEAKQGSQTLAERLLQQDQDIVSSVRNLTGMDAPKSENLTKKLVQALGGEEAQSVANASSNLKSAQSVLERVRGTMEEQTAQRAVDEAKSAFEDSIKNTLFKGATPDVFRAVKAGRSVENVVDDAKSAFSAKKEELYAPIKQYENIEGFDLSLRVGTGPSVRQEAARILSQYPQLSSGGPNNAFSGLASTIGALQETKTPMSLNQLRRVRDTLYNYANTAGEAFGTKAQADVKYLAGKITQSLNDQAEGVFGAASNNLNRGKEIAVQLKKANAFFSRFIERFDEYGVAQAFKPETQRTGQMAATLASEVSRQGVDAPAFENLVSLIDDLGKAGVKNAPSTAQVFSAVRSGLVEPFVDNTTGKIDFIKLADSLNNVERQSPGALKKIGFGSKSQLDQFVKFTRELGDKPGPEALIQILNTKTPAGFAVASEAVQRLPDFGSIKSVVSHLEGLAANNAQARDALLSLRAKQIEDILLASTARTKELAPNLGAIGEVFSTKETADTYRAILGDNLFNRIKDDFVPAYRRLADYKRATGQAASTVTGTAEESIVPAASKDVVSITGKKFPVSTIDKLLDLGMYKTASLVLARASGAAGYKSAADTAKTLETLFKRAGSSGNITALQKYADTGELPDEK
jgi:hypothetical protein